MSSHPTSGFHPVQVPYLVLGAALTGIAVVWLLRAADVVSHADLSWLLPIPWVAAGLLGLVATAVTTARRRQDRGHDRSAAASTVTEGSDGPATPDLDHEEQR